MTTIRVFGKVNDTDTYFCSALAEKIRAKFGHIVVEFSATLEVDYLIKLMEIRKTTETSLIHYRSGVIVLQNKQVVGDHKAFCEFALAEYDIADAEVTNTIVANRLLRENTYRGMQDRGRPVVFIEFVNKSGTKAADNLDYGKVYIELFNQECPKACANFISLCTTNSLTTSTSHPGITFHYANSPVHRIVKGAWIQCGDIVDGSGRHSIATTDKAHGVADEWFNTDFGFQPGGIVGYASSGPHSNGSQFFITTGPCAWMNTNFVGFGRVVQGYSVVNHINNVETNNQVPALNIVIQACGVAPEK